MWYWKIYRNLDRDWNNIQKGIQMWCSFLLNHLLNDTILVSYNNVINM